MRALYAAAPNPDDPLSAARVGDRPDPEPGDEWKVVEVKAASSTTTTCGRCVASG
jgi:hypothetical protein